MTFEQALSGLIVAPVLLLLLTVVWIVARDARATRYQGNNTGWAAGRRAGQRRGELVNARVGAPPVTSLPRGGDTEQPPGPAVPRSIKPPVAAPAVEIPDDEAALTALLEDSYDFGIWRSYRLQLMAMIVGAFGVALVYAGVLVTLGFLPWVQRSEKLTAATLSAIGGVAISLITGTFLREARLAQADLAEQRLQMQAHVREVRRERKGLQTLHELRDGQVKEKTGAAISLLLSGQPAASERDGEEPATGGSGSRRKRNKAGRAKRKKVRRNDATRTRAKIATDGVEEFDVDAAATADEQQRS